MMQDTHRPGELALSAARNQPLQPFLTASPAAETTGHLGSWQTYPPEQMPRGRLLDVDQASELADRGIGNETLYLRGDFMVTAARERIALSCARVDRWRTEAMLESSSNILADFQHLGKAKVFKGYGTASPDRRY